MTDDSIALREFLEKSADAEAADGARGAGPTGYGERAPGAVSAAEG